MPDHSRSAAAGVVLLLATVAAGLTAGVYFSYSVAIIPGLNSTSDRTFIEVMQRTNDSIQNPAFFAAFLGALALASAAAVQHRGPGQGRVLYWVLAGLVLYGIGFLVTCGVNVPLNGQLAAAGSPAQLADPAAVRARFETPWMAWHAVRTVASIAALGCLGWSLVLHGRSRPAVRRIGLYSVTSR
jgi:uncharacterized membrane protein